jgi:hypothetical protein
MNLEPGVVREKREVHEMGREERNWKWGNCGWKWECGRRKTNSSEGIIILLLVKARLTFI